MPTDKERREVARRLRRAWANVPDKNPVRHHMRVLYEIYAAVGLNDGGDDAIDLFARLADLIDPGDMSQSCRDSVACDREAESGHESGQNPDTVQIDSPTVQKAPECDRDALLELAYFMDRVAVEFMDAAPHEFNPCTLAKAWAREIREALGEI